MCAATGMPTDPEQSGTERTAKNVWPIVVRNSHRQDDVSPLSGFRFDAVVQENPTMKNGRSSTWPSCPSPLARFVARSLAKPWMQLYPAGCNSQNYMHSKTQQWRGGVFHATVSRTLTHNCPSGSPLGQGSRCERRRARQRASTSRTKPGLDTHPTRSGETWRQRATV